MSAWQLIPVATLAAACIVLAQRNPAFWLGIPMVAALGRSIFLDIYTGVAIPGMGRKLGMEDVLFLVLCICVVPLLKRRLDRRAASPHWAAVAIPFTILGWFALEYALSVVGSPNAAIANVPAVVKYAYVPLAAMAWMVGLRRVTLAEIMPVLRFVSWVCVVCGVFYISNAVGLQSYSRVFTPYLTIQEGGLATVRDYLTFPVWQPLALGLLLGDGIVGKARALSTCGALVLILTAVFSFTRVYIFTSVVAVVFILMMIAMRGRSVGRRAGALATFAGVATASGGIAWLVAPQQLQFAWARVIGLAAGAQGNVDLRTGLWALAVQNGAGVDSLLGQGFGPSLRNALYGVYLLDNWWAAVLVLFGWIGVALFASWLVVWGWGVGKVVVRNLAPIPLQSALVAAVCVAVFHSVGGAFLFSVTTAMVFPLALGAVVQANAWLPDRLPEAAVALRGVTVPNWWLHLPRGMRGGAALAAVALLGVVIGRLVAGG